ncbi:MAG: hypothetical protein MUE51_14650 [Thermoleophilia bacterium]|nr:hypothetical protein [Thermoleophilia bacterium]
MRMRRKLTAATALGLAMAVPATLATGAVDLTTADLKNLCETSAGNVVALPSGAVVASGAPKAAPETITTPCTIALGPDTPLEILDAGLRFDGPLTVRATGPKGRLIMAGAAVSAPRITADLRTAFSEVQLLDSSLEATEGDTAVLLGASGIARAELNRPGEASLAASGTVRVAGGEYLNVSMDEAAIRGAAVRVALNGPDAVLLANRASLDAGADGIVIGGGAARSLIDVTEGEMSTPGAVSLRLTGADSAVKATLTQVSAGGQAVLTAGTTTPNGLVDVQGSRVDARRVVVEASSGSQKGQVKFTTGFARAGTTTAGTDSDVIFRTGILGTTEVLESTLTALRAVRIVTGAQGTCVQQNNLIVAPVRQLC